MSANVSVITDLLTKNAPEYFTQKSTRDRNRLVTNQIIYLKQTMPDVDWQLEEIKGRWYKTKRLLEDLEDYKIDYKHEINGLDDEEIIEKMIKNSKKISKNTQK